MIGPSTSLRQLAFLVGEQLARRNIRAVLTGGGAAHIYAPVEYLSHDLDLVLDVWSDDADARDALLEIGFEKDRRHLRHPCCPFTVEFPAGPLAVGDDFITSWKTLLEDGKALSLISPTDCVRDRLAAFLFWNDRQGLETAVAVAIAQSDTVDLGKVADWCRREGHEDKLRQFQRLLERRSAQS